MAADEVHGEARRELLVAVRDELTYHSLLALPYAGGPLLVEASFVPPTQAELSEWSEYPDAGIRPLGDAYTVVAPAPAADSSPAGSSSLGVLEVRNTTGRDVYVAVLSVMEDRSRYLVWPHDGRPDAA